GLIAAVAFHCHGFVVSLCVYAHSLTGDELDLFAKLAGEQFTYIVILGEQLWRAVDDGDIGTQGGKEMAQFGANIAAADYDETARLLFKLEHGFVGPVIDGLDAVDRRHRRASTGSDEQFVARKIGRASCRERVESWGAVW